MSKGPPIHLDAVRTARANLRRIARDHPSLTGQRGKANREGWKTDLEEMMAEGTKDEQIVVRLPKTLLDRLDAHAERLRREMPGPSWKRSDVVRMLLARALDDAEPKRAKR